MIIPPTEDALKFALKDASLPVMAHVQKMYKKQHGHRTEIRLHKPGKSPCGHGYKDRCIAIIGGLDSRYDGPKSRFGRMIKLLRDIGITCPARTDVCELDKNGRENYNLVLMAMSANALPDTKIELSRMTGLSTYQVIKAIAQIARRGGQIRRRHRDIDRSCGLAGRRPFEYWLEGSGKNGVAT